MTKDRIPGLEARQRHGWLYANRWLIARRMTQIGFFLVFATGPWFGIWIAKGTLASSMTFDVLPLTDPLVFLQSLVAGHMPEMNAVIGAVIVFAVYALVGGRLYCSWVCPINPVADLAAWTRRRLGLSGGWKVKRVARLWLLAAVLLVSAITGSIAWELVNPITTIHRQLLFGVSWGALIVLAIFLFDTFVANHGWCGHLCPVGAFYGQLNRFALLRFSAVGRIRCDDCMDCYAVCPEQHVISPALKGERHGGGPVIAHADCTACGRCADVCPEDVFGIAFRFNQGLDQAEGAPAMARIDETADSRGITRLPRQPESQGGKA